MTPEELLDSAARSGLTLRVNHDALIVCGSGPTPAELIEEIGLKVGDVLRLLRCNRCGRTGRRLVTAYWGEPPCLQCCAALAGQHDARQSWPAVDWNGDLS